MAWRQQHSQKLLPPAAPAPAPFLPPRARVIPVSFGTISLRQVVSLGGDGKGVVAGYVHGATGLPGMGKNAALVALKLGESCVLP